MEFLIEGEHFFFVIQNVRSGGLTLLVVQGESCSLLFSLWRRWRKPRDHLMVLGQSVGRWRQGSDAFSQAGVVKGSLWYVMVCSVRYVEVSQRCYIMVWHKNICRDYNGSKLQGRWIKSPPWSFGYRRVKKSLEFLFMKADKRELGVLFFLFG